MLGFFGGDLGGMALVSGLGGVEAEEEVEGGCHLGWGWGFFPWVGCHQRFALFWFPKNPQKGKGQKEAKIKLTTPLP